jgi:hypothetical protein
MINDREEALAVHKLARTRIANRKQLKFVPFEKDQKVWLDTRNLKMNHYKKIAPKREGPFEIDEVLGPVMSGFHQVALRSSPDGLQLKELKEYSVSYSAPDYLGPVLGSKCLVMQT